MPSQAIVAIATAPGPAGLGVLRFSGPQAVAAASLLLRCADGKALDAQAPRYFCSARVVDLQDRLLDQVLAVRFAAPASYTGEDVVEVHAHGGTRHLQSLLGAFLQAGSRLDPPLRLAAPGEFTQRAFLNGKLDLAQAEAVADLIHSQAELSGRAASRRLEGRLSRQLESLRSDLLGVLASAEAACDFPEEEGQLPRVDEWRRALAAAASGMDALLATARTGRLLNQGLRVALCGAPNAGKSSLFNALLGSERSIVHAQPGTTRDYVEAPFQVEGFPMLLVDTAGLREGEGEVEQEGIRRSRAQAEDADLRLLLLDASRPLEEQPLGGLPRGPALVLRTKCDLPSAWEAGLEPGALAVSAVSGQGLGELRQRLRQEALGGPGEALPEAMLANTRHEEALRRAREALGHALQTLDRQASPDLLAGDVRAALDAVGEIVGLTTRAEVVEEIFRRFCIGK